MAINRFDQPAQAEFINTYVPIPFDDMMKIGMMKQQQVERNDQGSAEIAAALGSFQVAPFDQKGLEKVSAEYSDKLNNLFSSAQPGSYEVTKGLMKLRSQMAADPRLKDMRYNYEQYGQHVKNVEEANKDNATAANRYEQEQSLKEITEQGGAVGLIEKGQSGKWTPGSWYKNVKVREGFRKYVDDVARSSEQIAGIQRDSSGKYVLDESRGGRALEALFSPFGITFKEITKNGKRENVMEFDQAKLNRILASPEAEQIARDINLQTTAKRGSAEWNQAFSEALMAEIDSTVREFVSSDSAIKWSSDPYALARYKKDMEERAPAYTRSIIAGTQASTINSFDKYTETVDGFAANEAAITNRYKEYLAKHNVEYEALRTNDGRVVIKPLDYKGDDVSEVVSRYQAELDQEWQKRNDLNKKYNDIVRDVGVEQGWDDSLEGIEATVPAKYLVDKAKKVAERKLRSENMQTGLGVSGYGNTLEAGDLDMNNLTPSGVRRYEEIYRQELLKVSKAKKDIDAAFKTNAESEGIEIGVTPFTEKTMNDSAAKEFNKFVAEGGNGNRLLGGLTGARWVGTKEEFNKDDYTNLSSEKDAEFLGVAYDSEFSYPMYVYRPYDKKGNLLPAVMIEAPQGVETKLIQDGFISFAQAKLHKQLVAMENNASNTGVIGEGELQGEVRRLTKSRSRYSPVSDVYELTLTGIDPDTKQSTTKPYVFSSRQELIDFYTNFIEENSTEQ